MTNPCFWCRCGYQPFIALNHRLAHRGAMGTLHWCENQENKVKDKLYRIWVQYRAGIANGYWSDTLPSTNKDYLQNIADQNKSIGFTYEVREYSVEQ